MDNKEYIRPFEEEFDENDIVNRGEAAYMFDEEFDKNDVVNSKDGKKPDPEKLISAIDMADIMSDGDQLSLKNLIDNEDEDEFFGLIKKEDLDSGKVQLKELSSLGDMQEPEDFPREADNLFDKNDNEPELINENPAKSQEQTLTPEEQNELYLQRHFRDFMSIPKISGHFSKSIDNNLIPKDIVLKSGKIIEIADDLPHTTESTHQTSIIINRDEVGELESMEVICKCGERTLIKFDYLTAGDGEEGFTEMEDNPFEPISFDKLDKSEESPLILSQAFLKIPSEEEEATMKANENEDDEFDDYDEDDEFDEFDDDDDE